MTAKPPCCSFNCGSGGGFSSVFNTTYNIDMGGGFSRGISGFWGGFGLGLGQCLGGLLGGFGNMFGGFGMGGLFGGFGNMFGGFGMGGLFGGFGNMFGGFGLGGLFGGFSNFWGNSVPTATTVKCNCDCSSKKKPATETEGRGGIDDVINDNDAEPEDPAKPESEIRPEQPETVVATEGLTDEDKAKLNKFGTLDNNNVFTPNKPLTVEALKLIAKGKYILAAANNETAGVDKWIKGRISDVEADSTDGNKVKSYVIDCAGVGVFGLKFKVEATTTEGVFNITCLSETANKDVWVQKKGKVYNQDPSGILKAIGTELVKRGDNNHAPNTPGIEWTHIPKKA